jgi:phytanoyl-CoA hydroxylase
VEKGTLVVLHGLLPHKSGANTSPRSRHAYSLHLIDGTATYPEDNWLRRSPEMPPRGF